MNMREPNKVRAKLDAGKLVTGTAIYTGSPNMVEAAGYAGVDFVRIDTEHTWRRDDSLDNMIRAAHVVGAVPIVRVDRDDPYLLRKVLEIGAGGIIVPQIDTAAEAREVVRGAKFPPLGIRGSGPISQSGEWGRREVDEWIAWSNTQPLIGIMIETVDAMSELDAIVQVEGVDFVVFGPNDFKVSLTSNIDDAAKDRVVEDALRQTIKSVRAAGKHLMYSFAPTDEELDMRIEMGVTMLDLSHDVVIVRQNLQRRVQYIDNKFKNIK
jgi:4-hydroxy-2-oxoheptanedioate aldolase